VHRPSGLVKVEGSASTFSGSYLGLGRECFIEANIGNQSKSESDNMNIERILS
jgi:hypothetical protein